MITKAEIASVATATHLLQTTVEKDYVLSWVLHGISRNPLMSQWIFKGGTCLKKCYFETYRFSEDLDFTVPKGAIYDSVTIHGALTEIAIALNEETGIDIKPESIEVIESFNKNGAKTFEVKLGYIGPLNYNVNIARLPRIKFDITDDEIITDTADMREVFHSYSDAPVPSKLRCYSINEILAEKTRAMYQRQGRARDLYDIINIGRNFREDVNAARARASIKEKFKFKHLPEPSVKLILESIDFDLLKGNWDDQLSHQLPILPPVESFYSDLETELSWWMNEKTTELVITSISNKPNEALEPRLHFPTNPAIYRRNLGIRRRVESLSFENQAGSVLDLIRYAARNRLTVSFNYNDTMRIVEPYSLRRPSTGNLLLYVYENQKGRFSGEGIKAFKVNLISKVEILQESFIPKYVVEL